MEYVTLGGTGLRVSRLAYAVYGLRGPYEGLTKRDARRLVAEAWRLGINFYVTAPVYGREALEILAEGLGENVSDAVVAVLLGYRRGGGQSFEPEFIVSEAEEALEVLDRDQLDLVLLHDPGLEVLRGPVIWEAVDALLGDGLARYVGVSISQDPEAAAAARAAVSREEVRVLRFVYNMVEQEPGASIARLARERGRGILVALPHAGGLLLGEGPESWERLDPYYAGGKRIRGWYRSALAVYELFKRELKDELATLLEENTPAQLALRFIYSSIPVDSVEVAARSPEKLRELVEAAARPLLPSRLVDRFRAAYRAATG